MKKIDGWRVLEGIRSHTDLHCTFAVNSTFIGPVTETIGAPLVTEMAIFQEVATLHRIMTTHPIVGKIVTGRWSSLYLWERGCWIGSFE